MTNKIRGSKYSFLRLPYYLGCVGLSCDEELKSSDYNIENIGALFSSSTESIDTCVSVLGKNEIAKSDASVVWTSLKQTYGTVNEIPENVLKQLGWIISGIPAEDFENITITDINTVAAFGIYRNLSQNQLLSLKNAVFEQWSRKIPQQLTNYDLIALRQILCAFNGSEISGIHSDSYRNAAIELSTLLNCPKEILIEMAKLAMDKMAFGSPETWSSIQVTSVGCIMIGLSTITSISEDAMDGITPQIVKCLTSDFLQMLSESQLSHFTAIAAASLTPQQKKSLSADQISALEIAVKGNKILKRNCAYLNFTSRQCSTNMNHAPEKHVFPVSILSKN